jgi:hypothetical protein
MDVLSYQYAKKSAHETIAQRHEALAKQATCFNSIAQNKRAAQSHRSLAAKADRTIDVMSDNQCKIRRANTQAIGDAFVKAGKTNRYFSIISIISMLSGEIETDAKSNLQKRGKEVVKKVDKEYLTDREVNVFVRFAKMLKRTKK